ncbi:MAG: type IV pilus modification PilV family protein [Myxococcaceae bacterium]
MTARANRAGGFSLLEVVVALAILALSLMAIFDLNAGAVASHAYVKRLTIATLLARSKMTDIEQNLYDKGFSNDDEEDSGDFSDEGWGSFKWRAKIIAPKTDGMSPQQLIGGLFNLPMGGEGKDGEDPMGGLASLFMGGGGGDKSGGGDAAGGLAAMGPMAGMIQGQFTQMVDQLTKAVREVHLTVTWKDGKQTESFDLVTHVVSLGPGTDRNGGPVTPAQAAGFSTSGGEVMVDSVTGVPVPNPVPGPNGSPINPATNNPVIPASQFAAMRAGAPGPGGALINPAGRYGSMGPVPGFDAMRGSQLAPRGVGLEKPPSRLRARPSPDDE